MTEYSHSSKGKVIIGAVLILIGLAMLLDNFSLLNVYFSDYIISWQSLLIFIGIIIVLNDKSSFFGLLLILVGGISIAADIWDFSFGDFVGDYWPVILILLGLHILFRRDYRNQTRAKMQSNKENAPGKEREGAETISDSVDIFSIFGSGKKIFKSDNFTGGKITNLLGGTKIDLTDCKLAPGQSTLEIVNLFAGAEIYVPLNWNVKLNVLPIFGGFADKRRSFPTQYEKDAPVLILKGVFIFGGGEIKN